jgi:small subunit ribosomal protein S14
MPTKASQEKMKRIDKMQKKYAERRKQLKKEGDYAALQRLPRDASPTRRRTMCALTGRMRGNYRKFNVSRVMLRELALQGKVPGMRKASW